MEQIKKEEEHRMNESQSRWKSYLMWSAIAAQVITILQLTGALAKMGLDAGYVGDLVASFLQLLVIVGIINNPTNKTAW